VEGAEDLLGHEFGSLGATGQEIDAHRPLVVRGIHDDDVVPTMIRYPVDEVRD
jgi:hypothetical protein